MKTVNRNVNLQICQAHRANFRDIRGIICRVFVKDSIQFYNGFITTTAILTTPPLEIVWFSKRHLARTTSDQLFSNISFCSTILGTWLLKMGETCEGAHKNH